MGWSIRRTLGGVPAGISTAAEGVDPHERLLPTGRLEAFSDGVAAAGATEP